MRTYQKIYDFYVQINSFIVFQKRFLFPSVPLVLLSLLSRWTIGMLKQSGLFYLGKPSILNPTAAVDPAFFAGLKQMAGLSETKHPCICFPSQFQNDAPAKLWTLPIPNSQPNYCP